MSRWYDQHRLNKRLRTLERVQAYGALTLENVTRHMIQRNDDLRYRIERGPGGRIVASTESSS